MRNYEMMVIFDHEEGTVENSKKFVEDLFSANKIKITNAKDIGRKELAFSIKEKKQGFYSLYHFDAEQKDLPETEKALKLFKGILRYLMLRVEK